MQEKGEKGKDEKRSDKKHQKKEKPAYTYTDKQWVKQKEMDQKLLAMQSARRVTNREEKTAGKKEYDIINSIVQMGKSHMNFNQIEHNAQANMEIGRLEALYSQLGPQAKKRIKNKVARIIIEKFIHFQDPSAAINFHNILLAAADDFSLSGIWDTVKSIAKPFIPQLTSAAKALVSQVPVIGRYSDQIVDTLTATTGITTQAPSQSSFVAPFTSNPQSTGPLPRYPSDAYHLTTVSTEYLQAVICPENYSSRIPTKDPVRSAIAKGKADINVKSTANGDLALYVFPQSIVNASNFNFAQTALTLTPSSGVGTWEAIGAPLITNKDNIQYFRIVSVSVQMVPKMSLNNSSGLLQWTFFQSPPNDTFLSTGSPSIKGTEIQNAQFYEKCNSMRAARAIYTPLSIQGEAFADDNSFPIETGFYFLGTGFPVSTSCYTAEVSYVIEYIPSSAMLGLIETNYAKPGAATEECMCSILKRFPRLWCAPLEEANGICAKLNTSPFMAHDRIMDAVQ